MYGKPAKRLLVQPTGACSYGLEGRDELPPSAAHAQESGANVADSARDRDGSRDSRARLRLVGGWWEKAHREYDRRENYACKRLPDFLTAASELLDLTQEVGLCGAKSLCVLRFSS